MDGKIHKIQIQILQKLLYGQSLSYTELRPSPELENNQLNFHLNQLKGQGLVEHRGKYYSLSSKGKYIANQTDLVNKRFIKQAKVSIGMCPVRITAEGLREYLIYTRLKSPFYGCQGWPTAKVEWGETLEVAGARELEEEANLCGTPKPTWIKHYVVLDKSTREILEDKFMYFCVVLNPTGELVGSMEGDYRWVKESDLGRYVTNPFESKESFDSEIIKINEYLDLSKNERKLFNPSFEEIIVEVDNF